MSNRPFGVGDPESKVLNSNCCANLLVDLLRIAVLFLMAVNSSSISRS